MSYLFSEKSFAVRHPLLTGMAAGLAAGVASGVCDRLSDRMVSKDQKKRDRRIRKAPAHKLAGPYFAAKIAGRKLSHREQKRAQVAFNVLYGLGWGMIHSKLRRKFPVLSKMAGVRFGIPFFFACDGLIAPLLRISPALRRIPWQMSAKEMGNHVAWSAAAEAVHRMVDRKR